MTNEIKPGFRFQDSYGDHVVMAVVGKWAMVRRPHCAPYVSRVDWIEELIERHKLLFEHNGQGGDDTNPPDLADTQQDHPTDHIYEYGQTYEEIMEDGKEGRSR